MVQRKVPSIQADVISEKRLANLKLSSQHQDGKGSGADMKSRSIQLSDLEASQSSPSKKSFSQPEKPLPLRVPTTATSPKKQPQLMRTGRSPGYMKPTSSSDAKKEHFPVSLRNTQSDSYYKNQPPKVSSNWKASPVPGKQPVKTSTRSSSLKLASTLTKNPSFKPSRARPRKSSRVALYADMKAERATSSSTLKDSFFPACLMSNPGVTESEGTSAMKVCPYTFCSLNGHRYAPFPPLKSFLLARRSILKIQKTLKQEALNLQKLKVPFETKDSDIEQIVIDGKPTFDDAGMGFFSEVYAKVKEDEAEPTAAGHGDEMGKLESSEELQDQEVIESTIEESSMAAGEDNIKQVTTSMSDEPPESASNFEEDFKKYCDDVVTEADILPGFPQEQSADSAYKNQPPSCSHEDTSMGSCCGEIGNDWEQRDSSEMDGSDSEATDTDWKEEQFCTSKHEEEVVSAVLTEEETELKVESSSESSLEVSVKLDNIFSSCYEDILVEEALQEPNAQECACFESQPYGTVLDLEGTDESIKTQETSYISNGISCNQCSLIEEVLQDLTNAEENGGKNETFVDNEVNCATKVLNDGQEQISLEDGTSMSLSGQICDASEEGCKLNQVESATDKGSRNLEMKNTEIYQDFAKQRVGSNGYGSQGHEKSEPRKIDETNEDRNSSPETDDGSISQVTQIQLIDVHDEKFSAAQDQQLLEENESEAIKFHGTSCTGGEEQKTSKNWRGELRHNISVKNGEQLRKFNPREPNFLPSIPDPEREKFILKHQMMDERKSAEEWMLDYALRQAVTKLAPVRKSKVALLVEAFETVMPIPKWQTHMRNGSAFSHARTIQA